MVFKSIRRFPALVVEFLRNREVLLYDIEFRDELNF